MCKKKLRFFLTYTGKNYVITLDFIFFEYHIIIKILKRYSFFFFLKSCNSKFLLVLGVFLS